LSQSFNENLLIHPQQNGSFGTSIPVKKEDVKIAIFRLDYQTLDFKRSFTSVTLEEEIYLCSRALSSWRRK